MFQQHRNTCFSLVDCARMYSNYIRQMFYLCLIFTVINAICQYQTSARYSIPKPFSSIVPSYLLFLWRLLLDRGCKSCIADSVSRVLILFSRVSSWNSVFPDFSTCTPIFMPAQHLSSIPHKHAVSGRQDFCVSCPRIWSSLLDSLRSSETFP